MPHIQQPETRLHGLHAAAQTARQYVPPWRLAGDCPILEANAKARLDTLSYVGSKLPICGPEGHTATCNGVTTTAKQDDGKQNCGALHLSKVRRSLVYW